MSIALSAPQTIPVPPQTTETVDWKQQLAERLEAYRAKQHSGSASDPRSSSAMPTSNPRVSSIARTVASRFASEPSYREMLLAAQANQAAQEALAAETARELSAARTREESMAQVSPPPSPETSPQSLLDTPSGSAQNAAQQNPALPLFFSSAATGERVLTDGERAFAERYGSPIKTQPATAVMPQFAERSQEMRLHQAAQEPEPSLEELLASAMVEPRAFLPSKLIEFPRELVSSRRARPRLAENPGRGAGSAVLQEQESSQLRIFEVQPDVADPAHSATKENMLEEVAEAAPVSSANPMDAAVEAMATGMLPQDGSSTGHPSTISATHRIPAKNGAPAHEVNSSTMRAFKGLEWAAISLDKEPAAYSRRDASSISDYVPFMVEPASIDRRLMAFAVDFAAVTAGFLGFLAVFVASTPHLPTGLTAVALSGAVYASLWVLYQMLFFSLSGATAGMLYARIALCTFDDQNPSRSALRRRLAAWWLSCLPLGLGFLWSFVDEDNLCWHDRITRMYQRGY